MLANVVEGVAEVLFSVEKESLAGSQKLSATLNISYLYIPMKDSREPSTVAMVGK